MNRLVSLIGAPTDIGAGVRGASMGPEALRVADIGPVLVGHGLDVVDRGNLGGPANPWQPPHEGYRHLDAVAAWNRTVHDAVHVELVGGRMPILLGGDHSLGIGSISAVARHCREAGKKLRVLWLDAHADFNTARSASAASTRGKSDSSTRPDSRSSTCASSTRKACATRWSWRWRRSTATPICT
jgi:arginase